MTSLHWAARQGSHTCLRELVAHGGDVWAATKDGFMPIHWATMNGRDECLDILLAAVKSKADQLRMLEARDNKQRTPVMYAALNGHRTALASLLDNGADIAAVDVDGESALHKLASHGSVAQLEIILEKLPPSITPQALFSTQSTAQLTPLHVAFLRGHRDFVSHLLQQEPTLARDVVKMLAVSSTERENWSSSQWTSFTGVLRHLSRPEAGLSSLLLDAVVSMIVESGRTLLTNEPGAAAHNPIGFLTLIENYCTIFKAGDAQTTTAADGLEPLWNDLDGALAALARQHAVAIDTIEHYNKVDADREARAEASDNDNDDNDDDNDDTVEASRPQPTSEQIDGKPIQVTSSSTASTSTRAHDDGDDDDSDGAESMSTATTTATSSVATSAPPTTAAPTRNARPNVSVLAYDNGALAVLRGMYMIETDRHEALEADVEPESERFVAFVRRHSRLLQAAVMATPMLLVKELDFFIASPALCTEYIELVRRCLSFDEKKLWLRARLAKLSQRNKALAEDTVLINVSREQPLASSCAALRDWSARQIRGHIEVRFSDERGVGAGVLREWLTVLARDLFDQRNALFAPSADGVRLQPNAASFANPDCLSYFAFAGRVVALAIVHEELLDVRFTAPFYKYLVGLPSSVADVHSIDADVARNLQWLLDNPIDDADLGLTFSLDADVFGQLQTVELKRNGAHIAVTDANKHEYVQLVADSRTTGAVAQQLRAFATAFWEILPCQYIGIFLPYELELLISGQPTIDVDDWQRHSTAVGFAPDAIELQWFWQVVRSLSTVDQQRLLQFATGCPNVPAGGFARLGGAHGLQPFCVTRYEHVAVVAANAAAAAASTTATTLTSSSSTTPKMALLPTASTCFNILRLPIYSSAEQLRERLLVAIRAGTEGFEFA
jgi:hypothetical protein